MKEQLTFDGVENITSPNEMDVNELPTETIASLRNVTTQKVEELIKASNKATTDVKISVVDPFKFYFEGTNELIILEDEIIKKILETFATLDLDISDYRYRYFELLSGRVVICFFIYRIMR